MKKQLRNIWDAFAYPWREYLIRDDLIDTFLKLRIAKALFLELGEDALMFGIHINSSLRPQTLEVTMLRGNNKKPELLEKANSIISADIKHYGQQTVFTEVKSVESEKHYSSPLLNTLFGLCFLADIQGQKRPMFPSVTNAHSPARKQPTAQP